MVNSSDKTKPLQPRGLIARPIESILDDGRNHDERRDRGRCSTRPRAEAVAKPLRDGGGFAQLVSQ